MIVGFGLDFIHAENLHPILSFLEIKSLGLDIPNSKLAQYQDIFEEIHLFSQLRLVENSNVKLSNLKSQLQSSRKNYNIIIAQPISAGFASVCARDGRVDAVRITSDSKLKIFNTKFGRRLQENNKMVELDLTPFFGSNRAKKIRPILRILKAFEKCDLTYILSHTYENAYDLRSYSGVQAIGRILGLGNKLTARKNLLNRIQDNQKKMEGNIPFPGVEIE